MNFRKLLLLGALFLGISAGVFAQDMQAVIKAQAQETIEAMKNLDHKKMAQKTYPKILEMVGGEEALIKLLENQFNQFKAEGITFTSIEIGDPSATVKAGEELHCLIPQKLVLDTKDQIITTNGYLLGISRDQGKEWYFLDCAQLNNESVKMILPNFNDELKIPEKTLPTVVEKDPTKTPKTPKEEQNK